MPSAETLFSVKTKPGYTSWARLRHNSVIINACCHLPINFDITDLLTPLRASSATKGSVQEKTFAWLTFGQRSRTLPTIVCSS